MRADRETEKRPAPHRAPAFRHRAAKRADKPDSVRTARPKVRGPWQPFL
ncbi:hypothetical protein BUH_3482 [Burkholderia pseudomallei Pakistan 9]|nr:hypothetical protein BUH_3482 [Burkholderia pseudomallei Pakistan 9]